MIRSTDMPRFEGPLADPHNPTFCQRCEHEIYYECQSCNAMLGTKVPEPGFVCPHCGSEEICGPLCVCTNCDCGED